MGEIMTCLKMTRTGTVGREIWWWRREKEEWRSDVCVQTSEQRSRGGIGVLLERSSFIDSRSSEDAGTDGILWYSFLRYSSLDASLSSVRCEARPLAQRWVVEVLEINKRRKNKNSCLEKESEWTDSGKVFVYWAAGRAHLILTIMSLNWE